MAMGSTTDKVKGYANEAAGKVKRAAGDLLDDEKLKAEGDIQEAKGDAQKAVGRGKEALKDTIDKL
jgi:uncharacterized protein YjbJ (UPF0337 family)